MKRTVLAMIGAALIIFCGTAIAQDIDYLGSTLWNGANDIKVVGDYAYCVFNNGLVILYVIDAANPTFVSHLYLPGHCYRVEIMDEYAYVVQTYKGLQIVDVSDPQNPTPVSQFGNSLWNHDIAISGNYAFLVAHQYLQSGLLYVLDISDPTNPVEVGFIWTPSYNDGITLAGDYAYIANGYWGLTVYNISNPIDPLAVDTCSVPGFPLAIAVQGDYAYLVDLTDSLHIVNISNPANPAYIGKVRLSMTDDIPSDIAVDGDYAYVVNMSQVSQVTYRFQVVNVADRVRPTVIANLHTSCSANGVFKLYNLVHICDDMGVYFYNVTNPANPTLFGSYPLPDKIRAVVVKDNYAYVAASRSGLKVIDVSNPQDPTTVSSCATDDAIDIAVDGSYAYVADSVGLKIIDISNPSIPVQVGLCSALGIARGVCVDGNYSYISTSGSDGLEVIDISNPSSPARVATLSQVRNSRKIVVSDSFAYAFADTFYIINIADPINPTVMCRFTEAGSVRSGFVYGNYAYAGAGNRVQIIDISNPANPTVIRSEITGGQFDVINDVNRFGDHMYVGLTGFGETLVEFDLSDPDVPILMNRYNTPGRALDVFARDSCIYIADLNSLLILRGPLISGIHSNSSPVILSLFDNYPNPFNAQTTIAYSLSKKSDVRIDIFDIMGRKVETLVDGMQTAGEHQTIWNAEDNSSGIYFYRLKTGDVSRTERCILLK